MNSEILAGLIGGGLALAAALTAQALAAHVARRRRVREIAGRYIAGLVAVRYVADANRAAPTREHGLAAVQVQSDVIALAYELVMTAPRRLRMPVRTSINASLGLLENVRADPHRWDALRKAFDSVFDEVEAEMQTALRIRPPLRDLS